MDMMVQKRLLRLIKNIYFLLGSGFLIWITCFDSEDLITQYQLWRKAKKLEEEKKYYTQQIGIVQKEREELMTNEELLEKFAREKYYMRKPTEDVYVITK
jgi:cell division protein DivIC